jgi:hypothetical protein
VKICSVLYTEHRHLAGRDEEHGTYGFRIVKSCCVSERSDYGESNATE